MFDDEGAFFRLGIAKRGFAERLAAWGATFGRCRCQTSEILYEPYPTPSTACKDLRVPHRVHRDRHDEVARLHVEQRPQRAERRDRKQSAPRLVVEAEEMSACAGSANRSARSGGARGGGSRGTAAPRRPAPSRTARPRRWRAPSGRRPRGGAAAAPPGCRSAASAAAPSRPPPRRTRGRCKSSRRAPTTATARATAARPSARRRPRRHRRAPRREKTAAGRSGRGGCRASARSATAIHSRCDSSTCSAWSDGFDSGAPSHTQR